ncbi:hypothetical protein [Alloactinosynnema sp. L-07]|uniref:hypothetical protein n=1 Tax=Alloactinosynnema sp. L-07 TaxID=1653480 RepID=UPI00065EF4DC|nr:hypothetical protein [Alloactinosynnema sp. L-07]CRK59049.1 hypothetical protein [Alloactinosynnema sp. L-07]
MTDLTTPEERCDRTELLVDQCGCPQHRGDPNEPASGDFDATHRFTASFPGRCARCDNSIAVGDQIGSTPNGYICQECT